MNRILIVYSLWRPFKKENLDSSGRFLQNHWTRMEKIMVYWSVDGKSQLKGD
jgi:hypothetical protein